MSQFWNTVLSIFLGGVITMVVSYYFYGKSARDFDQIARWLDNSDISSIRFNRDDKNRIMGLVFNEEKRVQKIESKQSGTDRQILNEIPAHMDEVDSESLEIESTNPISIAQDKLARINQYIQNYLRESGLYEVTAVEAARCLDLAGVLKDSKDKPGKPLRDLLRQKVIRGQYQTPNSRWFIRRID